MKNNLPEFLRLVSGDLNSDDEESVDLLISEPIGFDPKTYSGISARSFGMTLSSIHKAKPVNLLINSLGGQIAEGMAMCNMIKARGNVTTVVVGFAASMGSILAQAGAVRKMMPGTMMIVHNPQAGVEGEEKDMEQGAKLLAKLKDNLVNLYKDSTGLGKKQISEMMDATTAMTPEEALELGFCDEVVKGDDAWNSLERHSAKSLLASINSARSFIAPPKGEKDEGGEQQTKKPKQMKLLIGALAAANLLPSADLTDEAAIVTNFTTNFETVSTNAKRVTTLEAENLAFRNAQKSRVTSKVENAITAKLVKPERKEALIAMGARDEADLDSYLGDLNDAKASAAPPTNQHRRGAPPVPPTPGEGDDSVEAQMKTLRAEMATQTPAEQFVTARKLRDLRGHKSLFAVEAK